MLKKVFGILFYHIVNNIGIYSICGVFLVMGIGIGSVYGSGFKNEGYFSDFFLNLTEYSAYDYVNEGFMISFAATLIIFVCGVSPLGCVALPLVIGYKGFVTGYTVSAFFAVYGLKTFVFIILAILPSAVFWLPVYLFSCVNGIRTSYYFLRILSRRPINDLSARVGELGISCVIFFLGVLISKFTEIFIIPQVLNLVGVLYA